MRACYAVRLAFATDLTRPAYLLAQFACLPLSLTIVSAVSLTIIFR